jgi:hypothetical protein
MAISSQILGIHEDLKVDGVIIFVLQSVLHLLEQLGDKRAEGLLGVELLLEKENEEGLQ